MLIKATLSDIERFGEFAYSLATDRTSSCYPTYTDGIKTKSDFFSAAQKAVTHDGWELLLYYRGGEPAGWISYFWIAEHQYLQLHACNIAEGVQEALTELLSMLKERYAGYTLYFGFPDSNTRAVKFLRECGFKCIEADWVRKSQN